MKRWIGCSFQGVVRAGVFVLGFAVLGPAVAESQILVICGIYRDSFADTEANLCHGSGSGCAECVFIALSPGDGDGEPVDPRSRNVTVASYAPRLLQPAEEPDQPLSLAVNTGLPSTPGSSAVGLRPSSTECERQLGNGFQKQQRTAPATAYSHRSQHVDAGLVRRLRRVGHRPGAVGACSGAWSFAAGSGGSSPLGTAGRAWCGGRCSMAG